MKKDDGNPRNTKRYSAYPLSTEQAIRKAMGVPEPEKKRKPKAKTEPEPKD
ncbi:MAG: hypothetical protein JNM34_04370 [Chthonomonadaceae bacterium]|nr:hypothetical protein [Chthonomonadaceae bacterium]